MEKDEEQFRAVLEAQCMKMVLEDKKYWDQIRANLKYGKTENKKSMARASAPTEKRLATSLEKKVDIAQPRTIEASAPPGMRVKTRKHLPEKVDGKFHCTECPEVFKTATKRRCHIDIKHTG